jgi:toxin ParE1/3/4
MAGKPVLFHPQAAADYEAAFNWYFDRSELAASKFAMAVNAAVDLIAEGPSRWPSDAHGTCKFVLQRFPFIIFYRELPLSIQILAVAHCHRRPGYWRERLRTDE